MQVMESRYKKESGASTFEKLSNLVGENYRIEKFYHELDSYEASLADGRVDILGAIVKVGVTVILRPLESVIGTLIRRGSSAGLILSVSESENLGNYILFDTKTRKRRHTDRAFSGDSLPYLRSNREIIRKFLR